MHDEHARDGRARSIRERVGLLGEPLNLLLLAEAELAGDVREDVDGEELADMKPGAERRR